MKPTHDKTLIKLADEIRGIAKDLPNCKAHPIMNRCDKISIITKKAFNTMETNDDSIIMTEKYVAKKAILEALLSGRHLSQMDCREFKVEDMRTPISHLKEKFIDTHTLQSKWILTPVRNVRIKEYWLEKRTAS